MRASRDADEERWIDAADPRAARDVVVRDDGCAARDRHALAVQLGPQRFVEMALLH